VSALDTAYWALSRAGAVSAFCAGFFAWPRHVFAGACAAVLAAIGLTRVLAHDWPAAGASLGWALLWFWLWWRWRRGKRRKALRALGAKARARLAAMLRRMPRAAPRLVPQGSPA
jgi:hypothetical protein